MEARDHSEERNMQDVEAGEPSTATPLEGEFDYASGTFCSNELYQALRKSKYLANGSERFHSSQGLLRQRLSYVLTQTSDSRLYKRLIVL